jgi:hypothetical protein
MADFSFDTVRTGALAMTPHTPATTMDIAQTVFETKLGSQFHRAVREFVHGLRTVPDCAPAAISDGAIQALRQFSERLIEQIERRLASGEDRSPLRQDLATAVHDIRSALEEIDHWRRQRHDAGR